MWDWAIWAALGVAVVATVWAAARAGLAGLRFFRDLKGSRGRVFGELDAAAERAERTAERAAGLGAGGDRLARSLARLTASRRRLAVLQSAWDEVSDTLGAVTALYPRK